MHTIYYISCTIILYIYHVHTMYIPNAIIMYVGLPKKQNRDFNNIHLLLTGSNQSAMYGIGRGLHTRPNTIGRGCGDVRCASKDQCSCQSPSDPDNWRQSLTLSRSYHTWGA